MFLLFPALIIGKVQYGNCIVFDPDPEGHPQPLRDAEGAPGPLHPRLGLPRSAHRAEGSGRGGDQQPQPATDQRERSEKCQIDGRTRALSEWQLMFCLCLIQRGSLQRGP